MKKAVLALLAVFIVLHASAQKKDLRSQLYKLEDWIIQGDIKALKDLAVFIDDTSFVREFLGHHNYPSNARNIAIRTIRENCLFTESEFKIDSGISAVKFLKLFDDNKIIFDDLSGAFLITALTKRATKYQLKELSPRDIERIDTSTIKHPFPEWYYENQVDWLIKRKNPEVLMWIASAWYKKRARFNRYYFNDNEFLDLIKSLTRVDLGVPDERKKITFLYADDYYAKARLNYLVYWVNHCKDYKWDEEKGYFKNTTDKTATKSGEEILFSLLDSKDDSTAIDAFSQLTELDTGRVIKLADEYESGRIHSNFSIPSFPYRFLKQMVILTQYCRDNGIKYRAAGWLLDSLNRLTLKLNFSERYALENNIVKKLKPEEITMVEYFCLIFQKKWDLTYSTGRILDRVYSKKWEAVISDKAGLQLYLKKTALYDRLGIIGICGKYLMKFENSGVDVLDKVRSLVNDKDHDIKYHALKILSIYTSPIAIKPGSFKEWEGSSKIYGVKDLKQKYYSILKNGPKDDIRRGVQRLFGQVSYQQLGESADLLLRDTLLKEYEKFHFLESDFGFPINGYNSIKTARFLSLFNKNTEQQLYEYYLRETGIPCLSSSGDLDFPAAYEVLKFDVVDAFAGGGGSRRETGVYLVIKLLELKFQTTLGYPQKLCSWQGMYSCNCADRAKAWMHYLTEKQLVMVNSNEPVSVANK